MALLMGTWEMASNTNELLCCFHVSSASDLRTIRSGSGDVPLMTSARNLDATSGEQRKQSQIEGCAHHDWRSRKEACPYRG